MRSLVWLAIAAVASLAPGCGGAPATPESTAMPDPLDRVEGEELFERATALAEQEDFVRAEQYYAAAMERGVPEERVIGPLVAACVRSSRLSSALGYAEPYLERNPDAWSLRLLVATLLMGLGEPNEARAHLARIVEDEPTQSVPVYMLAVLHRDALHDPANATTYFQRYLDIAPDGEHAPEARAAISHPTAPASPPSASEAAPSSEAPPPEPTPAVGVTGAPARPVRLPSQDSPDSTTSEAPQ